MPERHTVDFNGFGVNVLSDAERGTIVLQVEWDKAAARLRKSVGRRFGDGVRSRLLQWARGERDVVRIASSGAPHPENPSVIRVEMVATPGEPMDVALGVLLDFFREQPG